jgi:molybdopterin synthase catalytic subunit
MAKVVCELLSTQGEMDPDMPGGAEAGAILDFRGVVRGLEDGRAIQGIRYEVHEIMAQSQLERLGREAAARFALLDVFIRHRVGFVAAGEASLFIRLTARHRGESLKAMVWLIDELKQKVPIWKHPEFVTNREVSGVATEFLR